MFKLVLISLLGLGLGVALQQWRRPPVEELEYRATVAWNEGRFSDAEQLARTAMLRSSSAQRAREVMIQLSHAGHRPEIPLALTLDALAQTKSPDRIYSELGGLAMANSLLRVADDFIQDGLQQSPRNGALHRQAVSLSGLRLDAEEMQHRLQDWAEEGTPAADLVVMSLGLWSIDSRGAEPSETWLRAAVEADSTDEASRLGLARCLLAMGRYRECVELLEPALQQSPGAGVLMALATATLHPDQAGKLLPEAAPESLRGEYWFAKGLVALNQQDLPAASAALAEAVNHQPLNKSYRSRYCDVLRRQDPQGLRHRQVRELEIVVKIVRQSMESGVAADADAVRELAEMCRSARADVAADLLQRSSQP